jgi:putative membrane protein
MSLQHILLRWIISAIAILATTWLIPGITIQGNGIIVALVVALILGLVNAIIRPLLILLSCGCIMATLGLFMLVVNAATLWIASLISQALGFGFEVQGVIPAIFGSIVISLISWLLSVLLIGEAERGK